jgi:hypothetical protein
MTGAGRWHAVDEEGRDLATGRPPRPPGWPSPVAAVAGAPVVDWPVSAVHDDGCRLSLAEALGAGGDRVAGLLDALAAGPAGPTGDVDVGALAEATPAGVVELPLATVGLAAAVAASLRVDAGWLAEVGRRRDGCRRAVVAAGRAGALEAALHVGSLLAVERLDPADDGDVDAHVASGAQLWLLAGAVASALGGADPDPFAPWAALIAAGWWPVGPSDGRLVVGAPAGR